MSWLNKTYAQLQTEIKKEARVKGTEDLNQFILDTVNELMCQQTTREKHFELYVPDYRFNLADGSRSYDLPSDFQHLTDVRFANDGSCFRDLDPRNDYHLKVSDRGTPRFYELAGSSLRIYPFADVNENMAIEIDYYRAPTLFDSTDSSAVFPVPKLYNAVKRDAIARTHIYYKEYQSAQAFAGGASAAANESEQTNEVK